MLLIAFLILLMALVFAGLGMLSPWSEFPRRPGLAAVLADFWTGFALAIALLQIAQLIVPVGGVLLGLVSGLGLAGWAARGSRQLMAWLRQQRLPGALAAGTFMALTAAALATHVFFVPPHYDFGLYHMPTVGWFNAYAIVPGLGNLHHRLAFNNSNFLFAALLNTAFLSGRAYFLASTLPAFVLIVQCGAGFWALFRSSARGANRPAVAAVYWALMLPAVIWHISTTHLPGYSPDVIVFVLQAVLGGALLQLFSAARDGDPAELQRMARGIVLLAAAGVTVKLSFAPFAAFALLALMGLWLALGRSRGEGARPLVRPMLSWAAIAALLIVPWVLRSVILSGYPLFPSAALGLPVPWRIPEAMVEPISPVILNWARTVNSTIPYTGDLAWVKQWFAAFPFETAKRGLALAMAASAAAVPLALAAWRKLPGPRGAGSNAPEAETEPPGVSAWEFAGAAALFLASGLALGAWFFMAPDYRFSGALEWMLLSSALCLSWLALISLGALRDPLRLAVALALGLAIFLSPNHFELHKPGQQLLVPQPESLWVQQFYDREKFEVRTTLQGLKVTVPSLPHERCFDMPMPCTRSQDFVDTLRLFDPSSLQRGFYYPSTP